MTTGADEPVEDFRRRTARLRRHRTSRRLVQAFFDISGEGPVESLVVDDILRAAGMSRGTFYRHFPTMDAFLDHVAFAVGARLNVEMHGWDATCPDAAERLGRRLTYQVQRSSTDPVCAALLLRLLARDGSVGRQAAAHSLADFRQAVESGRFRVPDATLAADLGHGLLTAILRRTVRDGFDEIRMRDSRLVFFRAFGVADNDLDALADAEGPPLPTTPLRVEVVALCSDLADTGTGSD
ncbi:TetR/AcrR family transcriptional regulator [Nakamurella flava]|uniref:TetR/AcrR family transcriptional regulator n=1 Tax=Nakamurella flava TaxID=2576308 RepID=A0A4U6QGB8_9ACTN|nr:TetR/AcrR family transcriptional regulator [Nakamurella flava]TKV59191.1 TetR/AcrR family transcriptional regulator [Nakamurella flava]